MKSIRVLNIPKIVPAHRNLKLVREKASLRVEITKLTSSSQWQKGHANHCRTAVYQHEPMKTNHLVSIFQKEAQRSIDKLKQKTIYQGSEAVGRN